MDWILLTSNGRSTPAIVSKHALLHRFRYTCLVTGRAQSGLFADETPGSAGFVTAFCDGGARGNPGPAGFGVYVLGPEGTVLAELSEFLGVRTNNVAEYSGLLAALDYAIQHRHPRLRVVSDSELMVKQIQGRFKVKSPDLIPLHAEARRRIQRLDSFVIEHALRAKNKHADRLANQAMDRGTGRAKSQAAPAAPRAIPYPNAEPILKGLVKGGVIHLIEGQLPEGAFVNIRRVRQEED